MTAVQVKGSIAEAFSDVVLGAGLGLRTAAALDDYEDPVGLDDAPSHWKEISVADLKSFEVALSYFDHEGMRFHLPAFMSASLSGHEFVGLVFVILDGGDRLFGGLNEEQRLAVRYFLQHVRSAGGLEGEMIEESLFYGYWSGNENGHRSSY